MIHFYALSKFITAEVLEQLNQSDKQLSIEIHKYTKNKSQNKKIFESIISCITEGDKVLYIVTFVIRYYKQFKIFSFIRNALEYCQKI